MRSRSNDRKVVDRLREYLDDLYLAAVAGDEIRKLSTLMEELQGVLEGEF